MKILICGMGSIGRRHLKNLLSIGFSPKDIGVFRTRKGTSSFGDEVLAQPEHKEVIVHYSLDDALGAGYDCAIIANPTSEHVSTALPLALAGCNLLIEKPLSHNFNGVQELIEVVEKKGLVSQVAYNLRFHPLFKELKRMLDGDAVGLVVSAHAEIAERVKNWHPWESHLRSYACRPDLGGGVILTQSHELDMLYHLFGMPRAVYADARSHISLSMDVENVCQSILSFGKFSASLHVDYFKDPPKRSFEISGSGGRLFLDYFGVKLLHIVRGREPYVALCRPFQQMLDESFVDELKHFFACVEGNEKSLNPLSQGRDVLSIALATLESARYGKVVYPNGNGT